MKKLARLTALLLTGALLLALTACGAAPLTPEQQAKQNILTTLNKYRTSNGAEAVDELPELSKAEQYWVNTFREAGDYKVPERASGDPVLEKYWNLVPTDKWWDGSCLGWDSTTLQDGKDYNFLEMTDPLDPAALMQRFSDMEDDFTDNSYTAIGIGVTTINGKIYWACTLYAPKN